MKLFLVVLLISAIMLIAKGFSKQYQDKQSFYANLLNFLQQFKLNLSFKQEKLETFISEYLADKNLKPFLEAVNIYLNGEDLDLTCLKYLDGKEVNRIKEMVLSIGKLDIKAELAQLETYIEETKVFLEKAKQDRQKICPLIIKLSLLFGLALAIVLI